MSESHAPESAECFVIMPFGKKQLPDGRSYDFDKVYRVIISRAVREAGMKALRADETIGSRLIHSDMFKDLRDRHVVLADLSLENPNVFYELGIRHVMSATGTVLMCRDGTDLPFDVRLSRVVFYKFDGNDLDWEEVEAAVKNLKLALEDARRDRPDSPVHVLLETVLRKTTTVPRLGNISIAPAAEVLDKYERDLARSWFDQKLNLDDLLQEHATTVFGLRALGYFCLNASTIPTQANKVADRLHQGQQYPMVVNIYERLKGEDRLSVGDLLGFASAYSEAHPDLPGAAIAIDYARQALAKSESDASLSSDGDGSENAVGAMCRHRVAALLQWRWQLSPNESALTEAIGAHVAALEYMQQARLRGNFGQPGYISGTRIKLLLLLRVRDGDLERSDLEKHRDAILAISERRDDRPIGISYLHWYQAIALADFGDTDRASSLALAQLAKDAQLRATSDNLDIGRRQYLLLRRFLEEYAYVLRNPTIMAALSGYLLVGLHSGQARDNEMNLSTATP